MDWDWDLCRVCLEGGNMVSMFDCDENNELLRDKYKYTTDIEVSESDTLPTLICLTCVDRLMFAYQFKQQCVTSNDTLKESLAELSKSSVSVLSRKTAGSKVVTTKQENGADLHDKVPVQGADISLLTSGRLRSRPRTYRNQKGEIYDANPDYEPRDHSPAQEEPSIFPALAPKKKRRPMAKKPPAGKEEEDLLLEETIDPLAVPLPSNKKKHRHRVKKPPAHEEEEDIPLKDTKLMQPKKYKNKKNTKPFTCGTCGKLLKRKASLQAHMQRHLGIKPFTCSECGISFVRKSELPLHLIRHTGQKPYKCRICERRFADSGSRKNHERLHSGRPFQCTMCDKSYTYRYLLNDHMLTHTGDEKYELAHYNRKFTLTKHLKYYNQLHHKDVYLKKQMELEAKRKPLFVVHS